MKLLERYKEDGIWTMASPRETCIVPERPLVIEQQEEIALNRLALAAWSALETTIDNASINPLPLRRVVDGAKPFPDGLSMPPAIRIDTMRTADGPKIVEIDPVTAISLGETASLIEIWKEQGYAVPDGLVDTIATAVLSRDVPLAIDIPKAKGEYSAEIDFLSKQLAKRDVIFGKGGVSLSAFNDVPSIRRRINREGWSAPSNPLWGSLIGLADKTNLEVLVSGDKVCLPDFLPATYTREDLSMLDPTERIVVKPLQGNGSMGVKAVAAGEAKALPKGNSYQKALEPLTDEFGLGGEWVSRVSIYAGRYGLLGAQVTARRREPGFTNVHGQADAIQTTLALRAQNNA